jgi:hypothetical protein
MTGLFGPSLKTDWSGVGWGLVFWGYCLQKSAIKKKKTQAVKTASHSNQGKRATMTHTHTQ